VSRKRRLIILSMCLLSLFIVVAMPLTIAYPQPLLEVEVSRNYLTAGDEDEIEISITNVGGESAYDVKASLTAPPTVSGIAIVEESYRVFDEIEEGQTEDMYPVVYVASTCPLGAYSLTFTLIYYNEYRNRTYTDSMQIGVIVEALKPTKLALDVDVDDYRVTAGSENEIGITITNNGEEAVYDVKAVLTSTSLGIVILREPSYLFDEVDVEDRVNIRPLLGVSRTLPLGAYSLTLTLDYKDASGVTYRDSVTVGILVDSVEPTERTAIVVQGFQITPPEVHPGDELNVQMKIKNVGADAHDVRVQLTTVGQSPFVSLTPTFVFVGDIGSNKTTTSEISYDLRVSGDAKAQPYPLQLTISYYDVYGQPNSVTESISICVQGITSFQLLNVQPSSLNVEPGEVVTIEADLLLIGTETVKFVQVQIVPNHPFVWVSESYEYIGRVDPDSPVPFDVQFMVDSNATSGSYTLQMKVSYWDEYNQERQAIRELPVTIKERVQKKEEVSLSFWDIIRIVIRILLGVKP